MLGTERADPQQNFYRPANAVPDADGNVYVLDRGNTCVQAFDADGMYLRTMAREGQGPGSTSVPRASQSPAIIGF